MIAMYESVENFFRIKNVEVPKEWISACIDWLQSEHARQPANVRDAGWLAQKAYEQWQFTDLAELGCGCLPPGLADLISGVLDKDYVLQINSLREVGLPAYSQLQQLRKEDSGNSLVDTDKPKQQSWEPKPSRLLLLAVTDGVTQLQAMEYTPVPVLSLHTKPGTKVLVRGGVAVRRGVLLLTAAHVTVLGGAVDALLAPNAPENIINRALGLEETETPREYEDPPPPPATLPPSQASQYYPGTQPPSQLAATAVRNGVPSRNLVPTKNAVPTSNAIPSRNGNNPSSQNTSMQRNNFSNLWNDSQAFGRPADQQSQQQRGVADPIAAFDDDDDFLDMDVEAALKEAETQLGTEASVPNSSSTGHFGAARGSSVLGGAGPSTNSGTMQSSRGGRNVHSNAIRGPFSSASSNVNSRVGMSIDLSKNTLGANSSSLKKPQNNPFIESNFPDDDFEGEDLEAIEEEVKLIESQENRPSFSSLQSTTNQTALVSEFSNSINNSSLRSSSFQKPPPKHMPQPDSCGNSTKKIPFKNSSENSYLNDGIGSYELNSEVNDNQSLTLLPSVSRLSGKRPSDADSDQESEKSSKHVKLRNNDHVSSLASKIKAMVEGESNTSGSTMVSSTAGPPPKAMVQGESNTSGSTMVSSTAGPPPKGMASSSVANFKSSSYEHETALVSPLSRPEGASSVVGPMKGCPVTTAVKTKPPFTYLCFLPDKCSVEQEFIVKGFVMTLVSRLDPSSGQWRLPVKINDGSCSLDVDIHDQVLQKLIGMTVPEMRAYKARASVDPSIRAMLAKSVSGCQKELISLCCLLTVRVSPATLRPTLVALTPVQDCHALQLVDRAITL